jgi:nucleoside-diphosphate-sugar epimerase
VRALARSTSDTRTLASLGIEIVVGDVTDPSSLARAAAGHQVVFHTAGKVTDWGPREAFHRINVDGTANLLVACRVAGVSRLIHLSSLTVLGLPRDGRTVDEKSPVATPRDPYTASKIAGENLVRDAHGKGLATTVIRPGVIWGPGDVTIVPRIVDLLRRGLMVNVSGGGNLIGLSHVENLAMGTVLAAETAAAVGEVYHVTDGEEITARAAVEAIAKAAGTGPPRLCLPFPVVYGAAALIEAAARIARRKEPPLMSRYAAKLISCDCRYDIGKAVRDLGYRPTVAFYDGVSRLGLGAAGGKGVSRP